MNVCSDDRVTQKIFYLSSAAKRAALDASGFEAGHVRHDFVKRRAKGGRSWQRTAYKRFPKWVCPSGYSMARR